MSYIEVLSIRWNHLRNSQRNLISALPMWCTLTFTLYLTNKISVFGDNCRLLLTQKLNFVSSMQWNPSKLLKGNSRSTVRVKIFSFFLLDAIDWIFYHLLHQIFAPQEFKFPEQFTIGSGFMSLHLILYSWCVCSLTTMPKQRMHSSSFTAVKQQKTITLNH